MKHEKKKIKRKERKRKRKRKEKKMKKNKKNREKRKLEEKLSYTYLGSRCCIENIPALGSCPHVHTAAPALSVRLDDRVRPFEPDGLRPNGAREALARAGDAGSARDGGNRSSEMPLVIGSPGTLV